MPRQDRYSFRANRAESGPEKRLPGWPLPVPDPAVIDFDAVDGQPAFRLVLRFDDQDQPRLSSITIHDGGSRKPITGTDLRSIRLADVIRKSESHLRNPRTESGEFIHEDHDVTVWKSWDEYAEHQARPIWERENLANMVPLVMQAGPSGMTLIDPEALARIDEEGPRGEYTTRIVGGLYQLAKAWGESPNNVLQTHLGLSRPTASNWLKYAREAGTVPPSTRRPRSDRKQDDA